MQLRLCRAVPASLVLIAALPGCFDTHGRDAVGDAPDAAVPRDSSLIVDAQHTPADVGPRPPDAGFECFARPLDFACTDRGNGAVPVGEPFDLPVSFGDGDDCFCGEQLACAVDVHDGTIELTSSLCTGPFLCDGCFPFLEGRCAIPALAEGTYRVRVNGADSFELEASDALPFDGPVDLCATVPDDRECGANFPQVTHAIEDLCQQGALPGMRSFLRARVRVDCTELPTCEVERTANRLTVSVRTLEIGCPIDCGPGTFPVDTTCIVPPLEAGEYQLFVGATSEPIPFSVHDTDPPEEICTR